MADFNQIKTEIEKLSREKESLEKQITVAKTQHEMYTKELKEKYQITPEEIKGHIEALDLKLVEMNASLQSKLTTLREYVSKLKTALAES